MNDKTPAKQDVANAWFAYRCPPGDLDFDDVYGQEFERFIAEVERAAEERGYNRGYADGWHKFPKETP